MREIILKGGAGRIGDGGGERGEEGEVYKYFLIRGIKGMVRREDWLHR